MLKPFRAILFASLSGFAGLTMAGCGTSTNIFGRTISHDSLHSFENLLSMARAAYDSGDLDRAHTLAQEAYELDHDSEEAAVLFGFTSLSLAGGDPFRLADAIIAAQKTPQTSASNAGASGTLGALKKVIGLAPDEFALMGTIDSSDPTLPIMIPNCVENLRTTVQKLSYLNQAIRAVCRFVDQEARVTMDYRQNCTSFTGYRKERPRSHFLWAFAHLTEALAFNSVLTYGDADPTGKQTNLELRVAKIGALSTTSGPDALIGSVETLNKTLNAVMPTSGMCSATAPTTQLMATLNDMLAVDAAFAQIPGTPASMRSSLQTAMAKIKAVEAAGGSQTQALKGDFTKTLSKGLAAKLDALAADPKAAAQLTPEKKAVLCSSYASIAAGSGQLSKLCSGG